MLHTVFSRWDIPAALAARGRGRAAVVWHLQSALQDELSCGTPVVASDIPSQRFVGARFEDRLEHELDRHLNDPVAQRGNAQPSDLPGPALGDLVLAHRQRDVAAVLQRLSELAQELIHAEMLDVLARLAIDTGGLRPPVAFHPLPRDEQHRGVANQVEQVAEESLLVLDCPAVQLGLPSQYPLRRRLRVKRRERIHARPLLLPDKLERELGSDVVAASAPSGRETAIPRSLWSPSLPASRDRIGDVGGVRVAGR